MHPNQTYEVGAMEPVFIFSAAMATISLGGIAVILLGIVLGKIKV